MQTNAIEKLVQELPYPQICHFVQPQLVIPPTVKNDIIDFIRKEIKASTL